MGLAILAELPANEATKVGESRRVSSEFLSVELNLAHRNGGPDFIACHIWRAFFQERYIAIALLLSFDL